MANLKGTDVADNITGQSANDTIHGFDGNDDLFGGTSGTVASGRDFIDGGDGDDRYSALTTMIACWAAMATIRFLAVPTTPASRAATTRSTAAAGTTS